MLAAWLPLLATAVFASPLPKQADVDVKFDQRQEGEFNLRADLENFVILLIPASSPTAAPPISNVSLLDLLSKSVSLRPHPKRNKHVKKDGHDLQEAASETMHFIESKTAPYHVDISRAKLHPDPVAAESLLKEREHESRNGSSRISRAFVITVPLEASTSSKKAEDAIKIKKDVKRKHFKEATGGSYLKLLGAENEQCGPGLTRDAEGICRINKT